MRRDGPGASGLSRRDVLKWGASGVTAAAVVAACGSDDKSDTPAESDGPAARTADLAPFDPDLPGGPRTGLPRRVAWASTADSEFFSALSRGMETAAKARSLQYLTDISGEDPARNMRQLESFLATGVGALAFQPLDQTVQRPVLDAALRHGVCVQGIITAPSTLQVAASQYDIGFTQGKMAADFAVAQLGGNAEVHYFNLDSVSAQLKLRHAGVLDGLRTGGPGIRVVSDVNAITGAGLGMGADVMRTVIAERPNLKIVLGGDAAVVGAYNVIDEVGKLTDDMYFSGVDGDGAALDLIREGGPYRASIAFAWQLMGYGMGQFAADWIDGKQIPRVMVAATTVLDSRAKVDAFLSDNADPATIFADRARYDAYLPLLGNVSYETRDVVWQEEYVPR